MLPQMYELPAAIALVIGGTVACFAGYRLFRIVLAIDGFIAGAWLASSTMGSGNTAGMLMAATVGGIIGAVVLFFAYFVGIALAGAGLGAFIAHMASIGRAPKTTLNALGILHSIFEYARREEFQQRARELLALINRFVTAAPPGGGRRQARG